MIMKLISSTLFFFAFLVPFTAASTCNEYEPVDITATAEYCQSTICRDYCAKQSQLTSCMAGFSQYCKANAEFVNICSQYVALDGDAAGDSFCQSNACDYCFKYSNYYKTNFAGCMSQHFSKDCRKAPSPVRPPVQPPSESLKPGELVPLDRVVVGTYLPNWFVYSKIYMGVNGISQIGQNGKLDKALTYWPSQMRNLAPKLTHVYYAFMDLSGDCSVTDGDKDASWYGASAEPSWITVPGGSCKGLMNDMMALKSEFGHLNLMISLGGWTYSEHFSACAKTSEGRKRIFETFDYYVGSMDKNYGTQGAIWNGLDFDWEHPSTEANHQNFDKENDWRNYGVLIHEFRAAAVAKGHNQIILSSAIGVGHSLTNLAADASVSKAFCDGLDFVNLMTYDIHGKWVPQTGHNAPFCEIDAADPHSFPDPQLHWSVKGSVEKLAQHCPMNKLSLGIPNYSPAWTGIPAGGQKGLYQTSVDSTNWAKWSTFSEKDDTMVSQGIISFWDIEKTLQTETSFSKNWKSCPSDLGVTVPVKWVYSQSIGGGTFACYEDEETASKKAEWARKAGMRGFFFWDTQQDKEGKLLNAAWTGFGLAGREKSASGSHKCFDSSKPDFSKSPSGGEIGPGGCHQTGYFVKIGAGQGCAVLKTAASAKCNGKNPIAIGGKHGDGAQCADLCTALWDTGAVGAWPGDKVYFMCEGDSVPSSDLGPAAGGGISTCVEEGLSVVIGAGGTCASARAAAQSQCGSKKAVPIGGSREWQGCKIFCDADWSPEGMPWASDKVVFKCE